MHKFDAAIATVIVVAGVYFVYSRIKGSRKQS
jgi:hypothetical protein